MRWQRPGLALGAALWVSGLMVPQAGCNGRREATDSSSGEPASKLAEPGPSGPVSIKTTGGEAAVGLALEIDNAAAVPLQLKSGQAFFINQIDLRAAVTADHDEGVSGLARTGDFAGLAWRGITEADHEFVLLSNPDGTFQRRRFYRDADWMLIDSAFVLEQLDGNGHLVGVPIYTSTGRERERGASDGFFDRRMRAIQWTHDCRTVTDCGDAKAFDEEALVELRYAMRSDRVFTLSPRAAQLRLTWSQRPTHPYVFAVTQVAAPQYSYGIKVELEAVTPPRSDGSYAPGSDLTFRITLEDGDGKRLHPPGALPSYNDVIKGPNPAGIQYYRAFFDPTTTYWRRKHRERMMMAQLIGPAQDVQPIRTVAELEEFLGPDDVQATGSLARDGVFAQFHTFPTSHDLFGGAFDPEHAGWRAPVPDTWTHHLPADALAGTYTLTVKGRRTYMGQDIPYSRSLDLQVGTATAAGAPTRPVLTTGGCAACHNGPSALTQVLHGNDNRATCAACHVPLGFELEGPIYVRTHFIHSRSERFGAPKDRCAVCHTSPASILRTSKSACLSCHKSYPTWHAVVFGPVQSMYVGGGKESFAQCTSACHRTHPRSGL